MKKRVKEMLMRRLKEDHRGGRDYRNNEDSERYDRDNRRNDYREDERRRRDYRERDYEDYDYEDRERYERDERRGVKGTGRYGIGGSRHYPRRRDYNEHEEDYYDERRDYDRDYDYAEDGELKIKKEDLHKWKKMLKNEDGTQGEHFTKEQIMPMAEKVGVEFKDYDEHEFVFVANMRYAQDCEALRNVVTPEREALIYAKLAKAWLEPKYGPKGSEKLAMEYYCVIEEDEEDEEDFRRSRRR